MVYQKGHNNYGTSLQGYALLNVLQKLGYEVEIIIYIKHPSVYDRMKWAVNAVRIGEIKSLLTRIVGKFNFVFNKNSQYVENIALRTKTVDLYKKNKLLPHCRIYEGYSALHEGSKNYDTVIVGSDQVWTPMGLPTRFYNLLFVDENVKKVAYASSFGVSEIPRFQIKQTGLYLDRFYMIGVREQRGKEIVDAFSHKTAKVVVDPTFLLTREEWECELNENISVSTAKNRKRAERGGYIFCYFLGTNSDARKAALELKKETDLPIITIRHMDEYVESDEQFGDEAPYDVDPNDFVRYISHANYVCTDSFHCTVFSIIFHRQFMTFYRYAQISKTGRNTRIDSLFQVTGISRSHVYDGDIRKIREEIDWQQTEEKVSVLRKESMLFLQEALL